MAGEISLRSFAWNSLFKWFRSVVVIMSALHAEGRRFKPGRNHCVFFKLILVKNVLRQTGESSIRILGLNVFFIYCGLVV